MQARFTLFNLSNLTARTGTLYAYPLPSSEILMFLVLVDWPPEKQSAKKTARVGALAKG